MNNASMKLTAILLFALAGCSTTPERVDELEQARSTVQSLERQPKAQSAAATQLSKARDALSRADAARANGEPLELIRHEAYLARRQAEIGLEMITEAESMERIKEAEAERHEVQLQARTVAAERAEAIAREQTAEAKRSRMQADVSREAAEAATAEAGRLEDELVALEAEQTERGIVLTLGDVLFETDRAELKEGAEVSIDRLADFMSEQTERRLLIEGHTDSRGSDEYNVRLSDRRANAVAEALVQRGIASDRLRPVGLGEDYPVATNESTAGRQQNRRVEIVVSDTDGSFPNAAQRNSVVQRRPSQ